MQASSPIEVRMMTSAEDQQWSIDASESRLTGIFLFLGEELLDPSLDGNFALVGFLGGHLDIVFHGTILSHEGQEAVIGDIKLQTHQVVFGGAAGSLLTN
jgi:hypothetical protein